MLAFLSKAVKKPNFSLSLGFPSISAVRMVSTSPYGRSHVWKKRSPKLPNPIVPIFPQTVFLSDGSTFIHYITSPRSKIRLNRDLTNNPIWHNGMIQGMFEDEEGSAGRMGRFRRKFKEFSTGVGWDAGVSGSADIPKKEESST